MWREETTYGGEGRVTSPESVEWNHSLAEIVTAVDLGPPPALA